MGENGSFILYTSYQEQLELLTMEQRGYLLTAIMAYTTGRVLPEMDGVTKMAFAFIRANIDRDKEKYQKTCDARRQAGKAGGRPKANGLDEKAKKANGFFENQSKAKKANGFFENQSKAKKPDNDNDNENGNDNEDLSMSKDIDSTRKRVIEVWNDELTALGVTPIKTITQDSQRHKHLKARVRKYGIEEVLNTISSVKECSFLHGSVWFTFDWFIKPENFQKVHDGNYRDRGNNSADRFSWIDDWAGSEKSP